MSRSSPPSPTLPPVPAHPDPAVPAVIAHRGASAVAPENTVAALEAAWRAGADALHVDLRLTADGHPVALRDPLPPGVGSAPGGAVVGGAVVGGPPAARAAGLPTLAQARRLDAGRWFHRAFAGQRVPTLDEVTALVSGAPGTGLVLEPHDLTRAQDAAVVARRIHEAGLSAQTLVLVADEPTARAFAVADPALRRALVLHRSAGDPLVTCASLGAGAVSLGAEQLVAQPGLVDRLHGSGVEVIARGVDDPAWWATAVELGVDAVLTADPRAVRAWLTTRSRRPTRGPARVGGAFVPDPAAA